MFVFINELLMDHISIINVNAPSYLPFRPIQTKSLDTNTRLCRQQSSRLKRSRQMCLESGKEQEIVPIGKVKEMTSPI